MGEIRRRLDTVVADADKVATELHAEVALMRDSQYE